MKPSSLFMWPESHSISDNSNIAETISSDGIERKYNALYPSYYSVLFPSARSAIYSMFEYIGLKRSDYVGTSPFSSHCLIELVGRLSMPTTDYTLPLKSLLVNHQWGYEKSLIQPVREGVTFIEDSCDSIVLDESGLFPNDGEIEVFSLPKILGSTFGGIAVCRTLIVAEALKRIRDSRDTKLGRLQFQLKNKALKNKKYSLMYYEYWQGIEALNGHLPSSALRQIYRLMNTHIDVIKQRKLRLVKIFNSPLNFLCDKENLKYLRLPVVVPIMVTDVQIKSLENNGYLPYFRNFNQSIYSDKPSFTSCFPLPIHQQVSDLDIDCMLLCLEGKMG